MFGDLEQFGGASEGSEGMSEAAMEAFREQMRSAGQQLKALQKGEQKKKKKEEKLAKIISQFLQRKSRRSDLAFTAAEVLALNIPPAFVLSMLLLGDRESQQDLTMTAVEDDKGLALENQPQSDDRVTLSTNDLSYVMTEDEAQTAELHGEIIPWVDIMYIQAKNDALRLLKNSHNEDEQVYSALPNLLAIVMKYFLEDRGLAVPRENLDTLAQIILEKLFNEIRQNMGKLQRLRDAEFGGPLPTDV